MIFSGEFIFLSKCHLFPQPPRLPSPASLHCADSHLGLVQSRVCPLSSCFLSLPPDTCHLLLREPTPSLSPSLLCPFQLFSLYSWFHSPSSEGGVLQCEGGPVADSGNIVKYLTSLILQQIPNIDEILTQTTLLLLLLFPSRLNTVQSKPVKNRKCLSSAEPPPFLWQRNCRVVSRLHPVCNIFDNLDSRHQRGLGLI